MRNLARMDPDALLDLRRKVDAALIRHRERIEQDLHRLGMPDAKSRKSRKGYKVAPKYRGPKGETWAGRGAVPRWLKAAMKATGKRREAYLIK